MLARECELENNDTFEALASDGRTVVLQQRKRGCQLEGTSRRLLLSWWRCAASISAFGHLRCSTGSLRVIGTIFFVVLPDEPSEAERLATARALSDLLLMPVGFERGGRIARCLVLRICRADESKVKAALAYRTDSDRQGESGDVRTWPEWRDPRASAVLHGLLVGLATRLLNYADQSIGGFPASLRHAVQFLRQRGYPTKRWLRPFALELSRLGVPYNVLPRALRNVLRPPDGLP